MSAIASDRPAFPPSAGGAAHALRTAQSAFFRAAMGEVAAAAPRRDEGPGADTPVRAAPSPQPAPYSRPGALLDIRV